MYARPPHPLHRTAAFVAGLVLTLSGAPRAHAYALRHTDAGGVVAWSLARGPIDVYAESSGLSAEQDAMLERAVRGAVDAWNGHSALSLVFSEGLGPATGAIVVRWDTEAWRSDQEQLAVAALAFDPRSGDVKGARVRVNDAYHWAEADAATGRSARFVGYDLQSTLTHELGHAIGLAHSDVETATMHLGTTTGQSGKRTLDADDVRGLLALYGEAPDVNLADAGGCQDLVVSKTRARTTLGIFGGLALALWCRARAQVGHGSARPGAPRVVPRAAASTSPR